MYVCMYVCMYVRMYVYIYVYIYVYVTRALLISNLEYKVRKVKKFTVAMLAARL
jgi:hypothetical protein